MIVSSSGTRPVLNESRVFFGKVTDVDSDTAGGLLFARGNEGAVLVSPVGLHTLHRFNPAFGNTGRFHPTENDALLAIAGGRLLMWEQTLDPAAPGTVRFTGPESVRPGKFVEMDMIKLPSGDGVRVISKGNTLTIRGKGVDVDDLPIEGLAASTIRRPRIHPDGESIAVIANEPAPAVIVNIRARTSTPLKAAPSNFLDVAFSPNGEFLALRDATDVHVFSAQSWMPLFKIPSSSRLPTHAPIAFSHDSSLFCASGDDGVPVLYRVAMAADAAPWKIVTKLEGPQVRNATSARFGGPGHCFLLIGTPDGYLQTWNIAGIRDSLRSLGLDWDGPAWHWPEELLSIERVVVRPSLLSKSLACPADSAARRRGSPPRRNDSKSLRRSDATPPRAGSRPSNGQFSGPANRGHRSIASEIGQ